MAPDVLLMDEPFAALNALSRRKLQEDLLQVVRDAGATLLFVTHSIEEAVAFWDNRAVQHLALWDYYPQTCSGSRVTIKGAARGRLRLWRSGPTSGFHVGPKPGSLLKKGTGLRGGDVIHVGRGLWPR